MQVCIILTCIFVSCASSPRIILLSFRNNKCGHISIFEMNDNDVSKVEDNVHYSTLVILMVQWTDRLYYGRPSLLVVHLAFVTLTPIKS